MSDNNEKEFESKEGSVKDSSVSEKDAKWYVVHTYTGHEYAVRDKIQSMIDNDQNPNLFEVAVPMEEYLDTKNNSNKVKERKLFPGYVMVKMIITNRSWYIIRNTQGVTGFVGPDSKPVALSAQEVRKFGIKEPSVTFDMDINVGDKVKVIAGPFKDFIADVKEVDKDKKIIKAFVDMFGRDTAVDLSFEDIENL
ncbi:MAG: transcription termination/antitermination protein NusG [Peptoniphilaceae bacterium]|nr:transcription termination/antitermination protein NusG [Peptoniphilaceae bacterium]MDD7383408.1 transcription termination/antitermination protein NusG [Peptoniphilaceae bacterium]MDY3738803.1 transcription termination/antitermination protein NusG [Peptoniphilaceae bacterium]